AVLVVADSRAATYAAFGQQRRDERGLLPPPFTVEGWGGGRRTGSIFFVCPLPNPPADVGFIRLRPVKMRPNSGKPEFGCTRARGHTECPQPYRRTANASPTSSSSAASPARAAMR